MNTKINWKVGDWCYCEYKLQQVKQVEDGQVTCVSDGMFNCSAFNFNEEIFPISFDIRDISDTFMNAYKKIHDLSDRLDINMPEICGFLRTRWISCCQDAGNRENVKNCFGILDEFVSGIEKEIKIIKSCQVNGIKLFR